MPCRAGPTHVVPSRIRVGWGRGERRSHIIRLTYSTTNDAFASHFRQHDANSAPSTSHVILHFVTNPSGVILCHRVPR